jgi:hypothetical protein
LLCTGSNTSVTATGTYVFVFESHIKKCFSCR